MVSRPTAITDLIVTRAVSTTAELLVYFSVIRIRTRILQQSEPLCHPSSAALTVDAVFSYLSSRSNVNCGSSHYDSKCCNVHVPEDAVRRPRRVDEVQ